MSLMVFYFGFGIFMFSLSHSSGGGEIHLFGPKTCRWMFQVFLVGLFGFLGLGWQCDLLDFELNRFLPFMSIG
jgi:hypothetical protein